MGTFIAVLLKIVSIVLMIVFIASVALLILTFRKPKKVSIPSLLIAIAISLITLIIFASLTRYNPPLWLWFLMAILGIAIGWFWARTTRVYIKGDQVFSRNSIWYLVVWGGIFVLNQLIIIITNRPPDITMALLIISTATVWGTNGNIIMRYFQARGSLQPQAATAGVIYPPNVPPMGVNAAPASASCPNCGTLLKPGANFCMKCGRKL